MAKFKKGDRIETPERRTGTVEGVDHDGYMTIMWDDRNKPNHRYAEDDWAVLSSAPEEDPGLAWIKTNLQVLDRAQCPSDYMMGQHDVLVRFLREVYALETTLQFTSLIKKD